MYIKRIILYYNFITEYKPQNVGGLIQLNLNKMYFKPHAKEKK